MATISEVHCILLEENRQPAGLIGHDFTRKSSALIENRWPVADGLTLISNPDF